MNIRLFSLVALSSLCFGALFRFLLPVGDEPDYLVRVHTVYYSEFRILTPYFFATDWLRDYLLVSACEVRTVITGIKFAIGGEYCNQPFSVFSLRVFIYAIHLCVFFVLISISFKTMRKHVYWTSDLMKLCLVLATLFPSFIYNISVFSLESWALLVSAFSLVFLSRPIPFFILVVYLGLIDIGASLLLALFYFFRKSLHVIFKKYGLKTSLCIIFTILLALLVFGVKIGQSFVHTHWFGGKLASVSAAYLSDEGADVIKKYPIILRPIISFLTLCVFTPGGFFALPVVIIFGAFLWRESVRTLNVALSPLNVIHADKQISFEFLTVIAFISSVVFIAPGYANAKYYAFLTPILLAPFVKRYGPEGVFLTLSFCNLSIVLLLLWSKI